MEGHFRAFDKNVSRKKATHDCIQNTALFVASSFFHDDLYARTSPPSVISYPEHAGEADPGPGPPCQSGGQRQRHRGHPEKKKKSCSRQISTVFPAVPGGSTQALATRIHARRARCTEGGGKRNAALVFPLSDGLSQSPASELPPSLFACVLYLFHSWSFSLSLSVPLEVW